MVDAINKSAAAAKLNPVAQPQVSQLQQKTAQAKDVGKNLDQKTKGLSQEVSLTLSKEGQQLAKNPSATSVQGTEKTVLPRTEAKPAATGTGASYGSTVGAAATRTTAVKSQLEALQNKQSTPANAGNESTQKGNNVV